MCSIYGLIQSDGAPAARELIARMGATQVHRGPDDSGLHIDGPCAIGMRRLSIIDLQGGHQPIANAQQSVWVVCNGEIYNYRELQDEVVRAGKHLVTRSDTEVLVHLYDLHGPEFVSRLNGMFAFALWDARRRELLLGRDRLGVKPLHYVEQSDRFAFASEVKALLALPGAGREVDPLALAGYMQVGHVAGTGGLLSGVKRLSPGCTMQLETVTGRVRLQPERRYWSIPTEVDHGPSREFWVGQIREQLASSVHRQTVSDVPVGAFLSGGIDSSAIVAHMSAQASRSAQTVRTYSVGFEGGAAERAYNELDEARSTARYFDTIHREIIVRPDALALTPGLLWQLDEPVADSAFMTTALVARFARQDVKVILSGVGGDELFGGYRRYLGPHYRRRFNRLPAPLRTLIAAGLRAAPVDRHRRLFNAIRLARSVVVGSTGSEATQYRSFVNIMSDAQLDALLQSPDAAQRRAADPILLAFAGAGSTDHLNRLLAVDAATQLPDDLLMLTDRMTMAASLECRVPFLDHELVELAARIPTAHKLPGAQLKPLLRAALVGTLPPAVLSRRKRGFGAPVGAWMKREHAGVVAHLLEPATVRRRGWFDPGAVQSLVLAHGANRLDGTDGLLAMINLEIWSRMMLDGRSPDDVSGELASLQASASSPVKVITTRLAEADQ